MCCMTHVELMRLVTENKVPSRWYSINGGLKLDAHILSHNHPRWAYFFIDEFGNKYDSRRF